MIETCPFCKHGNCGFLRTPLAKQHYVECMACRATGPVAGTRDEAIKLWNRRHTNA